MTEGVLSSSSLAATPLINRTACPVCLSSSFELFFELFREPLLELLLLELRFFEDFLEDFFEDFFEPFFDAIGSLLFKRRWGRRDLNSEVTGVCNI